MDEQNIPVDPEISAEISRITNRQIAILMTQLDEINTSEIVKNAVKKSMRYLSDDIVGVFVNGIQRY